MSKVTADGMDIVTEASGHSAVPMAPSVCTTPAAPAPLPIPYPVAGSSAEGVFGAPSRTKMDGAKVGTVGGGIKAVHGNEPGTMKEIVSLATGGPAPILMGAPNVLVEMGMAGITGSPVMANRGPGPNGRTAPGPAMSAASVPGAVVLGGGGNGGAADGNGGGGKGGAGGGGSGGGQGGAGDQKSAGSGQPGQCAKGCPVDVVSGRAYTLPAVDLELPGPLPLVFARVYSSTAANRDVGLGFGWCHSWSWEIEQRYRELVIWSDEGASTDFPALDVGAEHVGSWGWHLKRERERLILDRGDGIRLVFAAADEKARRWVLVELRDRNDNRIELTYDEDGHLCEVIDSVGRTMRVVSMRDGRIAAIYVYSTRARGQWVAVARYAYDDAGNLASAVDAENHAARYHYDREHRLTRETDRVGLSFSFVYDRLGRCVETWGEYVGQKDPSLAEDVPARLADGVKARGIMHVRFDFGDGGYSEVADSTQVVRYTGNRHGLVEREADGSSVVETTYDARGLMLLRRDGEGAVTSYERDTRGQVVRVTNPLGHVTRYERDERGLAVQIVDPVGGVHEIHRDERGNVIHASDPTGGAWSYTYDERGLVTSATSPVGGVTAYAYDTEGNLIEQTAANGARWRRGYDLLGRCTLEVDPLGHETRFAWTERGDLAAVFRGEGATNRYVYDGERRVTEILEPGRRTTELRWGGSQRVVQRTDPAGGVVRYRYNREGELTEVHNAAGEVYRLRRDASGRVTREETFDGRRLAYKRDRTGRVVRAEVAGEVTEYAYDATGACISRTLPDDKIERFEHDALGALVRTTWPAGELRFERDAAGRVHREIQVLRGEEESVTSLYDRAGARVRRATSRGHVEQVERDAMGARTRTILDELHDVQHTRDLLGREVIAALPRGGRISHEYDPVGRVRRRWATSPGTMRPVRFDDPAWAGAAAPMQPPRVTMEREFRYDEAGELSDALDRRRGWVQYDYDPAGQLLSTFHESTKRAERFRYDAPGNPYEEENLEARVYGAGGQLVRKGDTLYRWDRAGRLIEKRAGIEVWKYVWDGHGRLNSVELPDGRRAEYAYDPLGRRMEAQFYRAKRVGEVASLVERTRFVWDSDTLAHVIRTRIVDDGDHVVEERTFCFEDLSFAPWAQCHDTPDGYGGRRRAWGFFVNDPIGTPDELVSADGGVLAELDRSAWGKASGASQGTPLRFPGQYEDAESGLFYNRFRYYDPQTGLYISPDPVGLNGGLRSWGYGINPTGWIDPLGLANYTAQSHAHVVSHGHDASSPVIPGKSRFCSGEGGQAFSDEVTAHPSVIVTHQPNGRTKYEVPDLGRVTGADRTGAPVRGGTVIVEGPAPRIRTTYVPDEVVTQYPTG